MTHRVTFPSAPSLRLVMTRVLRGSIHGCCRAALRQPHPRSRQMMIPSKTIVNNLIYEIANSWFGAMTPSGTPRRRRAPLDATGGAHRRAGRLPANASAQQHPAMPHLIATSLEEDIV